MRKLLLLLALLPSVAFAADNIDVTSGSGNVVAFDDVGGVKHQRVKIGVGTDGAYSDISSANPLPVSSTTLSTAANQTTIIGHVDGIEALLTTIDADTSTLAGAVSGAEMQCDIVTSALPTGAATSANQTTIIGHVDGIEALLTTIDADTSTLAGAVSGTEVQVDIVSGGAPATPTALVANAKVVTTAGTRVQLVASPTACTKIIITAEDDNTGKIYYGGNTVSSSVGDYLFPAQKVTLEIDDVNKIYIDAAVSGDGVKFTYFTS